MSDIQIVEIIVSAFPQIIEVAAGVQGPPGPDPWLDPVQTITTTGLTQEIDYSEGKHVRLTLESSPTLTVVGWPPNGRLARLTLEIQSTSTHTITWPAEVLWPAGVAPDLTPSGKDVLILTTTTAGTEILGFVAGLNFV